MNIKQLTGFFLMGVAAACTGVQAVAQERAPALKVGPIPPSSFPAAMGLSAPATLDGPQVLNVKVASIYKPINPCRLADTRQTGGAFGGTGFFPNVDPPGVSGFWGWAGSDGYGDFGGNAGGCGIPSTATAVHVNISVVSPQGQGYMRVWPNDTSKHGQTDLGEPNATFISWERGFSVTNAGTISICSDTTESSGADFCIYPGETPGDENAETRDFWVAIHSQVAEHIIIDALGYYEPLSLN